MEELLAIVDSIDTIPDAFKKFYKKGQDGKFYLQVKSVGNYALEDVGGLKAAASEASSERNELKTKLAKYEGIDPEQARKDRKKLEEMKDWSPDKKTQELIDTQVAQVKSKLETDIAKATKERDEAFGQLDSLLINNAVLKGFNAHKFVEGGQELLTPHVVSQMKVVIEDGKRVARFMTDKGTTLYSMKQNSGTSPMEAEEFLEQMKGKKAYSHAFAGSGASGTGKGTGSPSGKGNNEDLKNLTPTNRLAELRRRQVNGA